ncbi:MAG: deoxyribodipyrimidine photo-lyase [Phycisphaeraceae bacterium]|nr:deoxyribodipyrimidine photo-lyase [Phycisphaeraceae bacterium]
MPALMWFRSDLRTADNKALRAACKASDDGVIAAFLITPTQWREHDWAGVKIRFILRTLRELSADLAALNIPLRIVRADRFADAPEAVARLCREVNCTSVHTNAEYEINERRRDDAVQARLASGAVTFHRYHDQVLLPPGSVSTAEGRYYTVFSPFKRAYYKALLEDGFPSGSAAVLQRPRKQPQTGVRSDPVPDTVSGFETDVPDDLWPAGERAASKRLDAFIAKSITRYKDRRDFPALEATSTLSPYLAVGAISPRQCLAPAVEANGDLLESKKAGHEGPNHWISELVWRDFYKHILVGFPRVCMHRAFKPDTERILWNNDQRAFEAWTVGRTGVPIVDAGMRQLLQTGWMHNRVRMITAMYLTKDLFIDWRWGERHFMRHLIDGDLASNNGGWQWSASTGTDAAPYFRIFNPVSQSRRFDPDGAYIRTYVPELADLDGGEKGPIHDPSDLPALLRGTIDYPEPIADHAKARDRVMKVFQSL